MDVNGGERILGSYCNDEGCWEVYEDENGVDKRPLKVEIEVRG